MAQGVYVVAGLAPQARPEGAPVIAVFERAADWREKALWGISKPYPPGLAFLDSQGAWYTPFVHPGMTGPYDLRQWHLRGRADAEVRRKNDE